MVDHEWVLFFFFNDTATTEIYTLSLHDALPIFHRRGRAEGGRRAGPLRPGRRHRDRRGRPGPRGGDRRSEEHTSELQSRQYLVCRLLLEKKKKNYTALLLLFFTFFFTLLTIFLF